MLLESVLLSMVSLFLYIVTLGPHFFQSSFQASNRLWRRVTWDSWPAKNEIRMSDPVSVVSRKSPFKWWCAHSPWVCQKSFQTWSLQLLNWGFIFWGPCMIIETARYVISSSWCLIVVLIMSWLKRKTDEELLLNSLDKERRLRECDDDVDCVGDDDVQI